MAITQTGAMYKSLSFDNTSSRNYGVYITGEAVYNAPERAVEMISIPGRNGAFALDQGRFENIEVSYPAGIFADNEADFAQAVSDFRNFVCSRKGYCRLTDEYNPNEYRMAVYKSGLEVDPAQLRAGEFTITFDCKPQRWLTDGETPVDIGTWGDTETETGDIVEVDNPDGILAIKDLQADIVALQPNAYDSVWVGGAGKNKCNNTASSTSASGVTYTVNADKTVSTSNTATASGGLTLYSNFTLSAGSYVLSGCPSGGSGSTYALTIVINGTAYYDYGSGYSFTLSQDTTIDRVRIVVYSGANVSNKVWQPMIRKSTESADFEPWENICPISGFTEVKVSRTGVNVWDEEWVNGRWAGNNGVLNTAFSNYVASKNKIPVLPNTTYYLYCGGSTAREIVFYDASKAWISDGSSYYSNATFTTPSNAYYITFNLGSGYGNTYNNDISINYPSTDTSYHAYQGDTYTIDLDGTRYGGTLDVTTGVLTVTHAITTVGALTWYYNSGIFNTPASALSDKKVGNFNLISSGFKTTTAESTSDMADGEIKGAASTTNVYVKDSAYTDASSFKTARSSIQICYELATPLTVNLTAQEIELLQGANNVWADSGDVTVEYGVPPYTNFTLFESNPLIKVTGLGTLTVGSESIVITGTAGQVIYIDCESKEIYKINGGVKTSAGSLVTFSTSDFPQLEPGTNKVVAGTGITAVEITPRWWKI